MTLRDDLLAIKGMVDSPPKYQRASLSDVIKAVIPGSDRQRACIEAIRAERDPLNPTNWSLFHSVMERLDRAITAAERAK